jgi:hypothetical protein
LRNWPAQRWALHEQEIRRCMYFTHSTRSAASSSRQKPETRGSARLSNILYFGVPLNGYLATKYHKNGPAESHQSQQYLPCPSRSL